MDLKGSGFHCWMLSLAWGEGGVTRGGDCDVGDTGDGLHTCGWDGWDDWDGCFVNSTLSMLVSVMCIVFVATLGLLVKYNALLLLLNVCIVLPLLFNVLVLGGMDVVVLGNFQWVT